MGKEWKQLNVKLRSSNCNPKVERRKDRERNKGDRRPATWRLIKLVLCVGGATGTPLLKRRVPQRRNTCGSHLWAIPTVRNHNWSPTPPFLFFFLFSLFPSFGPSLPQVNLTKLHNSPHFYFLWPNLNNKFLFFFFP